MQLKARLTRQELVCSFRCSFLGIEKVGTLKRELQNMYTCTRKEDYTETVI